MESIFKVYINENISKRINWLVNNYKNEIGAFLTGEIKDNKIYVDGLLFYEQEVSIGEVDADGKALVKMRGEYGDECERIIGHFHSHNIMRAFWSATDEEFIKQFSGRRDLTLFIVASASDGMLIRLELNKPLKIGLDGVNYEILTEDDLTQEMKGVIGKYCKERVVKWGDYGNWGNGRSIWNNNIYDYKKPSKKNNKKITEVNKNVIYKNNNCVEVRNIDFETAQAIINDFKLEITFWQDEKDTLIIKDFENQKEYALVLLKDIRDYLVMIENNYYDSFNINNDIENYNSFNINNDEEDYI